MKRIIIYFLLFLLIGCGGRSVSNDQDQSSGVTEVTEENVIIYIFKGKTQCNNDGLSPEESIQQLADAGIDVLKTFCGVTTGLIFLAICGGGTGDIIAHEIREVNFYDAKEVGYKNIETVVDIENNISYEIGECEDT